MKSKIFVPITVIATLLSGVSHYASAATVTFDENGNGSINFGSGPTAIPGTLQQDPGPGGQPSALTYVLNAPNLTAGDLLLTDGGKLDDLVRFNPTGTGSNPSYLASVLIYSSNVGGAGSLADTSQPPFANYSNTLTIPEIRVGNVDGVQYTPTSGQPGFVPGFAVTYDITSDTPEPSSMVLLLSGAVLLVGLRICAIRFRWHRWAR